MTDLPPMPGVKIIREKDVQPWIDAYAFIAGARADAQAEMERIHEIREAGRKEGYEAGFQQGAQQAGALLTTTTARINDYVASLDQQFVDLSLSIIVKVLGKFGDAELVTRLAHHALQSFQRERDITIAVAPDIAEDVARRIKSENTNPSLTLTVVPDPHLNGTQCVLSNAIALVDASLEMQLSAIRQALLSPSRSTGAA